MVHKMHLRKGPFHKIWSGEKYIELRMLDEKRKRISVGDMIEFAYEDNPRITMMVKVGAFDLRDMGQIGTYVAAVDGILKGEDNMLFFASLHLCTVFIKKTGLYNSFELL